MPGTYQELLAACQKIASESTDPVAVRIAQSALPTPKPRCKMCGKEIAKHRTYCSRECRWKDPESAVAAARRYPPTGNENSWELLPVRVKNALKYEGYGGGDEAKVARLSRRQIASIPNMGRLSVYEVEQWLERAGLSLAK